MIKNISSMQIIWGLLKLAIKKKKKKRSPK